jgi:hypothetical protein
MRMINRLPQFLACALCVMLCASCGNEQNAGGGSNLTTGSRATQPQLAESEPNLDLGEDWSTSNPLRPAARSGERTSSAARSTTTPERTPADEPAWSIVLNTFSGETHATASANMIASLRTIAPQLTSQAHVRSTASGSMVMYGLYPSLDDPRAREDLERIKSIKHQDVAVFPRAFLTRTGSAAKHQVNDPNALLSVRQRHPNVDPLYTLQVAAWSDFETGQLKIDELRKRAEAHARDLRAKGFEAYYHHGDSGISVVTVGLFDRTAYDVQLGDLSPDLTQLRKQFPEYLVNGEPLMELIDRHNPRRGTRPQVPRLVLVPKQ